ncbi:phage tail spike protein [Gordonibacter sp.]|uniref:phage tail spike protein n=3 Tax=Gordonibacter sp. TaxID=1968902 RepID=UPI002FC966CB
MEFYQYDRWDNPIGPIAGILAARHRQEAGGENSLTLTTIGPLAKGDRIVWCDEGTWREHVANEPSATRDEDGVVSYETYCEDALAELFRDKVDEKRIRSGTATQGLTAVLEQTRWSLGTVTVTGSRTKSFYHCSVGESLQSIAETWGGEVYSSFAADERGITRRYVNFVGAMGSRSTHKRFEYRKDLLSVKRTVSADDVYTAMRGYGKGEAVGDDEWGRRITFADINSGKDYLADASALARWGRPDDKGGKAHAYGTAIFEDCEDAAELKELTQQALDDAKEPKVAYECKVLDLKGLGRSWEGVGTGDSVQVIDTAFNPALRLEARIMALDRNLLEPADVDVSIGNIRNDIGSEYAAQAAKINALQRRSASWDVAAYTPSSYINQIIDGLNKQFDAGMSYVYQSPEQGIIVGSVPLDPMSGKPTRLPASAIQLKGGGFRIASAVKADGSFNWRTFGTGTGFTADEITAGTIRGGSNLWNLETGDLEFRRGVIRDSNNRSTWNLSTGSLTTNYMTANNITANGTMSSGSNYGYMAKLTGGMLKFYYSGAETIELVSIPSYTSGAKGGYIQACNGATYLGLRAPQLYTARNTSDAGTTGFTGDVKRIRQIDDLGNGSIQWWTTTERFINGICTSA